jgi:SAM-dependent methyltransferase
MPDAETFAKMYGPAYATAEDGGTAIEDPKEPETVLTWLRRRPVGVFVDFGCGSGSLLRAASALGWTALGVEYQDDVVRRTAADTGCEVLNGLAALRGSARLPADVIHLGDVIEHLPAPLDVLQDLVGLLRPGGWLMAQGPLEAGPCLFTAVLRAASALRSGRVTRMPPYHVLQASVEGQRVLFDRVGLSELTYTVSEVAWPAPGRLSGASLSQPRSVALYALRKLSQAVSAVNARRWGNRYFYVGMAAQPLRREAGR